MARRRYLSSAISTDKIVNRLALEAGDFAALLYTWMIPHAADNATVSGDPEELLMQVFPGRRDKQPQDVADALAAMVELGLITWDEGCVRFPASFYKYQAYIRADRREIEESAQNGANPRTSAQKSASFKSSLKLKSSLTDSTESESANAPQKQPTPLRSVPKTQAQTVPDDFTVTDDMRRQAEGYGVPLAEIDRETEKFRDHFKAHGKKMTDWPAAWRNWMRRVSEFAPQKANGRYPTKLSQAEATRDRLLRIAKGETP